MGFRSHLGLGAGVEVESDVVEQESGTDCQPGIRWRVREGVLPGIGRDLNRERLTMG